MKIVMHEKCMDVAFEIVWERRYGNTIKLKGYWLNLGYSGNPFRLFTSPSLLKIPRKDWDNWKPLTSDNLTTKRTKPGLP